MFYDMAIYLFNRPAKHHFGAFWAYLSPGQGCFMAYKTPDVVYQGLHVKLKPVARKIIIPATLTVQYPFEKGKGTFNVVSDRRKLFVTTLLGAA